VSGARGRIETALHVRRLPDTIAAGEVVVEPFCELNRAPRMKGNTLVYILWLAGFLGAAFFAVMGVHLIPISERDFVSVWVAGKLASSGHALQAFDNDSLRAAAATYAGTTYKIAFPYPPHILLFAVPMSLLPLAVSFFVWQAISGLLFYFAAKPHLSAGMPSILVVLTPSAVVNVTYGQNGLFLGALWLFAFSGSALSAALLTVKPHIGFLVAFEMVRRKQVLSTSLIAIAVVAVSGLLFGLAVWHASLANAATTQFSMINSGKYPNWFVQMTTPFVGYGYIGWFFFALSAGLLLLRCFNVFTAATATFLISPYGFHYDMTVVCLGFGVLLFERWRSIPPWQTLVCALAFLSPVLVRAGTWLVPPILLLGLFAQTMSWRRETISAEGSREASPI
jgi:hypothetical protein